MSVIAGLQDYRQEGPPGDVGVYEFPATVLIFEFTFSGVTYLASIRAGVRSWNPISQGIDAATVWQAAHDSLPAIGGSMYLKGATLVLTSQVSFNRPIHIRSARGTVIQLAIGVIPPGTDGMVQFDVGSSGSIIEDCEFDGNGVACRLVRMEDTLCHAVNSTFRNIDYVALEFTAAGCEASGCTFENNGSLILGGGSIFVGGPRTRVINNIFLDDVFYGVYAGIGSRDSVIVGNILRSTVPSTAFGLQASAPHTLIEGNRVYGYHVAIVVDTENTAIGNICDNSGNVDIYLDGISTPSGKTERTVVVGNICLSSGLGENILLNTECYDCTIEGNTIYGGGTNGISIHTVNCLYNVIANNTILSCTVHGIAVEPGCNYNTVQGNIIRRSGGHGIYVDNAHDNTIEGNICLENDVGNTATYDGICLANGSSNNIVLGNKCVDNDRDEIRINAATETYNIVVANHVGRIGADHVDGIVDNGTGTEKGHNIDLD